MGSVDLESMDYSPLAHLNQLFESPAALLELDDLLAYTRSYKGELDQYLIKEKALHNNSVDDSIQELGSIEDDLIHIMEEIENTKKLAKSTEKTINSMTSNIKKLDNCKKNMTLSMTILKRLQMLITSFDNVEHIIYNSNNKNYYEIYQLLSAVMELMNHFQSYKSIDDINNLDKKINELKIKTVDEIFNDFGKELNSNHSSNGMELTNACKILDLLGSSYHDKLLNWFISSQLREIQDIFRSTEEAGSLENLNRRFIFFKRVFKTVESKYSAKFPLEWNILYRLSDRFCDITRLDLKEVLAKESQGMGVNLLLSSLSETLEFENFLNMKFKVINGSNRTEKPLTFDSTISSVFEPYLDIWIEHQDKTINEKFLKFMTPGRLSEKNGTENGTENDPDLENEAETNSLNILNSSADLFRVYRSLLSQLSKLSNKEPLLKLANLFVKYLEKYLNMVLRPMIPQFQDIKGNTDLENEQVLMYACLVLNTADYCVLTIGQLQERLTVSIVESLVGKVEQNFEKIKDNYTSIMNQCLNLICVKINEELALQWRTMINLNWKNLVSVEDTSSYIYEINKVVNKNARVVFDKINRNIYLKTFMNKLVELINYSFFINIVKLKPITEVMSEQLLLDLRALRDNLLNLPELYMANEGAAGATAPEVIGSKYYINFVKLTTGNIELVLRVLLIEPKPVENLSMNYFYIIGDKNFNNFVKVLKLKGLLPLTGIHHGANFNKGDINRYKKLFQMQMSKYEDTLIDADDNNEPNSRSNKPLIDNFKFLDNHNIDSIDYNTDNNPSWLISDNNSNSSSNNNDSSVHSKLSSPIGNVPTGLSFANANNVNKLINTRKDQVEKNFSKTIDNFKINDNFKNLNIGKLFKRNDG